MNNEQILKFYLKYHFKGIISGFQLVGGSPSPESICTYTLFAFLEAVILILLLISRKVLKTRP